MSNIIENQKSKIKNQKLIKLIMLCLAILVCFSACDSDKIYNEERYKHVVYLLSGAENIYTEAYRLDQDWPVRYFSVGIGGSLLNKEEVIVNIVPDRHILGQYNSNNFDYEEQYARLLSANRYKIESLETFESLNVTLPANPVDQYVKVAVAVDPHGLSPDTTYFIPVAINSVSRYEINRDKYNMLYRVTIENEWARQRTLTYYTKDGEERTDPNDPATASQLSGTKIVQPLTRDEIRMFVGNHQQNPQTTTRADIERYAIRVKINPADNTVDIEPYGSIQVIPLIRSGRNIYNPAEQQGLLTYRVFYLYYQYRILQSDGVTYGDWVWVDERLTRVDED